MIQLRLFHFIKPYPMKGIQDYYPDHFGQCYGCGRLNEHGYQLKTAWEGEETLTRFTPSAYHTAIPGSVYGGLLASLIDCHGTGSAALALARGQGAGGRALSWRAIMHPVA